MERVLLKTHHGACHLTKINPDVHSYGDWVGGAVRGHHVKSCCTFSHAWIAVVLPASTLSQSAAASSSSNQETGSLLKMLRGWRPGTVSKSHTLWGNAALKFILCRSTRLNTDQRVFSPAELFRVVYPHLCCVHTSCKAIKIYHKREQHHVEGRDQRS